MVDSISETNEFLEQQQEQDQEDRDNIEQQSSDIDSDASDSQQDAENTGTTLLAAFSSFVTAITSASPSNCNLDMDLSIGIGICNIQCVLSHTKSFTRTLKSFINPTTSRKLPTLRWLPFFRKSLPIDLHYSLTFITQRTAIMAYSKSNIAN